ncbi:DUF2383 domain-containing protein [Azospirillum sp. sgz302134]
MSPSSLPPAPPRGRRGKDEIEQDIHTIRARMDSVLDEIEFRLSPGQLSGGVIDVVRDVAQGNPTRIARAIRSNPWPLAVMAAGALWLAWNVSRTPELATTAPGSPAGFLDDRTIRNMLSDLVMVCRQGATGFRQAELVLDDPGLTPRLTQVAAQFDRSAAALDDELRRRGGAPAFEEEVHPVWGDLHGELGGARSRGAVLAGLERGVDNALALFREALHEELPEELRVVIGAHFHEIETVRHRVGALREAVA